MIITDKNSADKGKTAIRIDNLTVKYGEILALENIFLDIKEKEYLGIIGPNGSGKTTLLRTILGLVKSFSGHVEIYGKRPGHTGKLIGYVPQITGLNRMFPITVKEVVVMGKLKSRISLFHKYKNEDMNLANELLAKVGIYDLRDRLVSELSGGQFQKMLIARALAINPKILLLDEPTASVDVTSKNQIFNILEELSAEMTIILVTHDLLAISTYVHSLACLNIRLVYHGKTEIDEQVIDQLYGCGCPVDLLAHGVPHRVLREHGEEE